MGFGTYLFCDLYFNRSTFETKEQVKSELEQMNSYIKDLEGKLYDFGVMTEPDKFFKSEESNINYLSLIREEINDTIQELEGAYIDRYKLELLIDNWDSCHTSDGKAITPKFDESKYSAFLSGDFVPSDRGEEEDD